jgi:hypothetical protein
MSDQGDITIGALLRGVDPEEAELRLKRATELYGDFLDLFRGSTDWREIWTVAFLSGCRHHDRTRRDGE